MAKENGLQQNGASPETSVHVIDERTGNQYTLPISHNAVTASEFQKIKTSENQEYYADQNEQGLRIFDPGFSNTAVSTSQITYVDGPKGLMQYRGYPIGDIIGKKGFLDTAFLLIWGEWPKDIQLGDFKTKLLNVTLPDQPAFDVIRSFPPDGSCMGMIIAGLSAIQSTQMPLIPAHAAKNLYLGNSELVDQEVINFMGSYVIIVAIVYCHHTGRHFTVPRSDFSYIENFFLMTGHVDPQTKKPNPKYVNNFERLWILIANHEMTCSTAALLQTASSLPDVFSCMISALSALYGPLHGGAIEVAYKNIKEVGTVENAQTKIERVKAGKERLYGYGHRLYKVTDPRSVFIREIADQLQEEVDEDPLLKVAFEIDRIASKDEYFTSRKLSLNADLYAAFAYKAMGFPPELILPISTIGRTAGFMAHWKEAMAGSARIWRPGQIYTGHLDRKIDT